MSLVNKAWNIITEDRLIRPKQIKVVNRGKDYSYSQHGKTEVKIKSGKIVEVRKIELRKSIPNYNMTNKKLIENMAHELAHLRYIRHGREHTNYSRRLATRLR